MKANELMIGDYVCCTDPTPFKIEAITIIETPEYVTGNDGFDVDIADLEPIPLTEEILEKNGFKRYGQVYANLQQWVWKFGDKRKSFVQDIRTGEWGMNDVWINYVHELQHVLRICGIDKEIVL